MEVHRVHDRICGGVDHSHIPARAPVDDKEPARVRVILDGIRLDARWLDGVEDLEGLGVEHRHRAVQPVTDVTLIHGVNDLDSMSAVHAGDFAQLCPGVGIDDLDPVSMRDEHPPGRGVDVQIVVPGVGASDRIARDHAIGGEGRRRLGGENTGAAESREGQPEQQLTITHLT